MDVAELLHLYRAQHDVILPGDAGRDYFRAHHTYVNTSRGDGWVSNDEESPSWPHLLYEREPDYSMTTFMVPHGEGEPAAYCYSCPRLLTLNEILIDSPLAGCYRPICQTCKESRG